MKFDAIRVKEEAVAWVRDWFAKNGPSCKAVIGISGGKDSSVVAALCCEALGKDRVIGVLMPNGVQPDIRDSYRVVEYLGIHHYELNIAGAFGGIMDSILTKFGRPSEQTTINLAPRLRMTMLYALSQSVNGRVANTCNLSEDYVGYSTRWGDSVGDFSPLANLTSEEVVELGLQLGLPEDLVRKAPSDGLCGKTDEDSFGFSYRDLNTYIRLGKGSIAPEIEDKIERMHQRNLFKLLPIPAFDPTHDHTT